MGSNDAIAGGTSGRWRNNGICVSRSAPQPSGFLFFRVCVFHNVAHSSAWCAPLSTERQPGRAMRFRLRTTLLLQRVLTITGSQRDPV